MPPHSVHDLRRSCITNWAKHLPIHVVQQLAGHNDIRTTQKYYLSVQSEDIKKAQRVQPKLLGKIAASDLTDPLFDLAYLCSITNLPVDYQFSISKSANLLQIQDYD